MGQVFTDGTMSRHFQDHIATLELVPRIELAGIEINKNILSEIACCKADPFLFSYLVGYGPGQQDRTVRFFAIKFISQYPACIDDQGFSGGTAFLLIFGQKELQNFHTLDDPLKILSIISQRINLTVSFHRRMRGDKSLFVSDEFHLDVIGFPTGMGTETDILQLLEVVDQFVIKVRVGREFEDPVVEVTVGVDGEADVDLLSGEIGLGGPPLEEPLHLGEVGVFPPLLGATLFQTVLPMRLEASIPSVGRFG
jgi:hypothetical protein